MPKPKAPKPSLTIRISEDHTEAHATIECDEPMTCETIAEKLTAAAAMVELEGLEARHAQAH